MFDFDLPELDLGSRRRQAEWVSVDSSRPCQKLQKQRRRHRQREKKAAQAAATAAAVAGQQPNSCAAAAAAAAAQPLSAATVTPAQAKHNKKFRDSSVVCLSTEIENGNVEYKYCLSGCISNPNRRHQLVTQMKYRLSEGGGECFYYIGVEDDGYPRGLDSKELSASSGIIASMAASLAATARLVEYVRGGFGRRAALVHIKANAEEGMSATDLRVAVAGSMDSGKSTLVAVLTHGSDGRPLLDNCRGSARMAVFRHKHEIESGRTSSISQQVLGYDAEGRVLNYVGVSPPTPADITAAASRMLTFIDMGGHEKYLKTTLYGMTCTLPDYVLLCIDALCGVTRITREHLAVAVALEVPTALVITKADAVDARQLQSLLQQLRQLMAPLLGNPRQQQHALPTGQASLPGGGGTLPPEAAAAGLAGTGAPGPAAADGPDGVPLILTEPHAVRLADGLSELHSCTAAGAASFRQVTFPVFTVSCVTGAGLSLLHAFLSRLQPVSTNRSSRQCGAATVRTAVDNAAGSSADGTAAAEPPMPAAAS
ncbi:P-loop containing nucleoside triphosphate hydrolase protein [Scenedesmus sp. NREL 46B-D3]|nr:P-loop containing nucleoside triphosphate hydrolase protein [Scenedesmus sp. NREL 46B-D3]